MAKVKKEQFDKGAVSKATKKAGKKATSDIKNATNIAKEIINQQSARKQKLTKSQKKQRKRADLKSAEAKSLHYKRLEKFARDVEGLRKESAKLQGTGKAFASQLQEIRDKNCLTDLIRPMTGQHIHKCPPQSKFEVDTGKKDATARREQWMKENTARKKQKIKCEFKGDGQHIKAEAGLDGAYIKQEDSLAAQAGGTRNTTAYQALPLEPLPASPDAPYAQWLQQQEGKMALVDVFRFETQADYAAYRAAAPASAKQYGLIHPTR